MEDVKPVGRILLINGSPRGKGCTYTALDEMRRTFEEEGVEAVILDVPKDVVGCKACLYCKKHGRCIIDDEVNRVLEDIGDFDGMVLGSPVYFAGPSGQICSFSDRLFYAGFGVMAGKLAAAVVSCRRGGATAAFDRLNKYFTITNMNVVGSQYWNQVHGNTPEEVLQDVEGMQTMRILARNMAWMIRSRRAAEEAGVEYPELEQHIYTNFIR